MKSGDYEVKLSGNIYIIKQISTGKIFKINKKYTTGMKELLEYAYRLF